MIPDFTHAFEDGHEREVVYDGKPYRYRMEVKELGNLRLTTGRLVACDPLATPDAGPFGETFPPGEYPVLVSVARLLENDDQRVAYAMLRLSNDPVAEWKMLAPKGADVSKLADDEIFGYPVDSGTGCFMDEQAAKATPNDYESGAKLLQTMLDALDETYVHTWSWANLVLDKQSGANMIAFSSGVGDGYYASYVGYARGGVAAAVVTDFAMFGAD